MFICPIYLVIYFLKNLKLLSLINSASKDQPRNIFEENIQKNPSIFMRA